MRKECPFLNALRGTAPMRTGEKDGQLTADLSLSAEVKIGPAERENPLPPPLDAADKQDLYTVLALLVAAFCVRLYSLQFFHVIATDGTSYALTARALAGGDLHGIGTYGLYPVLIALTNLFISDLETAGRITSVIAGSLLVVPLYFLGKAVFSRKVAVSAALICIVWPSLVASSCEVITQATHTTLQLSAVFFLWRAFKIPSALNGSLAGIFMGLTFLTRPEGILLFVALPLALCIVNFPELRRQRALTASYCGSFLILFLLNLLLVHHVTGEWQLSAKTDSALNDALGYYLNIPDLNYIPGYEPKGYLDILRDHPGFIFKNTILNLKKTWETMLPPLLWLFFTVGLFSGGFNRERNTIRLFLIATFAPVSVLIVFYYISAGYVEAYMPIMFLFAAYGFTTLEAKLKEKISARLPPEKLQLLQRTPLLLTAAFVYAAVTFAPQIRKDISDAEYLPETDNFRRDEKHIGLLLKDSLPPGKIMTRWARIAFYAEREWVNIPAGTTYEEIIRLARSSGVRFFIADGTLYSNRPMLGMELFEPLYDPKQPYGRFFQTNDDYKVKGLQPFMFYTDPRSMGVMVYEIDPEPS